MYPDDPMPTGRALRSETTPPCLSPTIVSPAGGPRLTQALLLPAPEERPSTSPSRTLGINIAALRPVGGRINPNASSQPIGILPVIQDYMDILKSFSDASHSKRLMDLARHDAERKTLRDVVDDVEPEQSRPRPRL